MDAPNPGKRPGEKRYLALAAVALAAVLVVFLRDSLVGGKALSQLDHLFSFAPWSEVAPPEHRAGNHLLEDQAILMVPWLEFAAEELRAGRLPLWNPYNYGGQPIHAANSGSFLWPVNALYYLFPGPEFYAWSALVRLLLAGLFAVLYLRSLGVSRAAALPAALAFSLCGFLVVWLNHPHSNVALTVPLHLWLLERLAARGRWRDGGLLALAIGAQLLGGHSQTSLHLLLVLGVYVLFRTIAGTPRFGLRAWGVAAVAGLLGLLVAAAQLLPMGEYLSESRGVLVLESLEQTSELDVRDAAVVMVSPDHHGGPHTHDYRGPAGRNLNYSEILGGYVGRLVLLAALIGVVLRWREPHVRFFALLVAGCALVAWQVWPVHDLFRSIPRVRSTNPTRLLLYVAFGLSVLGALGLDGLTRRLGRSAALVCAGAFLVVAAELIAWGRGYNPEIEPDWVFPATPTTDFLAEDEGLFRVLGIEQTTLRAGANLAYRVPMLTGYDKIEFEPQVELVELLSNDPGDTFVSEIPLFDRGEALPLASALNVRYLVSTGELPPPLELAHTSPGGVHTYRNPFVLPRAFAATDVRVIEDKDERLAFLGSPELDPRTAVLSHEPEHAGYAAFRAARTDGAAGEGTVEVVSYLPREVILEARLAAPGLVVLADTWAPGWNATVDGEPQPIERVDHALRGVWVPEGTSELVFRYEPASFLVGAGLSLIGLLATAAMVVRGGGGGRPRAAAQGPAPNVRL
ncbi:MAG: hypothetical protein AAF682_31275 [Planctomycetota bacterium]